MAETRLEVSVLWCLLGRLLDVPFLLEVILMPTFSTLPISEARARSATGKRAVLLQEYVGYIERVAPGEAGLLQAEEGETFTGDPPSVERGSRGAGQEARVPPDGRRRLLLDVGWPKARRATQESGRVTWRHWETRNARPVIPCKGRLPRRRLIM